MQSELSQGNAEQADSGQIGVWNGRSLPTLYSGTTFRSRTEARWAVFMDALGVPWHYEHEGFDLGGDWYLPDFWVPSIKTHLEIKPVHLCGDDARRARGLAAGLADLTGRRVVIFYGSPAEQPAATGDLCGADSGEAIFPNDGSDFPYAWCRCPGCGKFGIEYDGRGARVCGPSVGAEPNDCIRNRRVAIAHPDKGYSHDDTAIAHAYLASRARRFR